MSTVPRKDIVIPTSLHRSLHSNQVVKLLKSCVNKFYSFVNLKIVFQSTRCIKSFFPYKDRINRSQQCRVIYRAKCWDCNGFYIGKTKRRLHDTEENRTLALAKNNNTSAIADYVKATGHNWDHFNILAKGKTDYHCKIKETLFIQELELPFNFNVTLGGREFFFGGGGGERNCNSDPLAFVIYKYICCFKFQGLFLSTYETSSLKNMQVEYGYHRCLCLIFDQTTMAQVQKYLPYWEVYSQDHGNEKKVIFDISSPKCLFGADQKRHVGSAIDFYGDYGLTFFFYFYIIRVFILGL